VPLLVLCVQEPELSLKRVAASALSDIAKHTPELAQAVVDAGAVAYLAPLVVNQDAKLKRQVRGWRCVYVCVEGWTGWGGVWRCGGGCGRRLGSIVARTLARSSCPCFPSS
jgi:hypothetical protein